MAAFATIRITLWRRKLREATNKRDNEIHERATDRYSHTQPILPIEKVRPLRTRFPDASDHDCQTFH